MSRSRAWVAVALLAVTWPLAADWTLRYEETFLVEDYESSARPSESVLRFNATQARFDSERQTFLLDTEEGRLVHVRPDGTAVVFPFPLDLAALVSTEERADLETARDLIGAGETTVTDQATTRTIRGQSAVPMEVTKLYDLGGRFEATLWLAESREDQGAATSLLGAVGQLRVGLSPWMDVLGQEGRLPLEVETIREGQGPRKTRTLRLLEASQSELPADLFEPPDEVKIVPFRLQDYFRIGPSD